MGDEVKINYTENNVNPDNLSGVLVSEDAAESIGFNLAFIKVYLNITHRLPPYLASLP